MKNKRSFVTSNAGFLASAFAWGTLAGGKKKMPAVQFVVGIIGFLFWGYVAIMNLIEFKERRKMDKEVESHFNTRR